MCYGKSPFIMPGLKTQSTSSGDFGGLNNTNYHQMPVAGQFQVLPAHQGHTQKSNVTTPSMYKGNYTK
jgi:hypothetical protein